MFCYVVLVLVDPSLFLLVLGCFSGVWGGGGEGSFVLSDDINYRAVLGVAVLLVVLLILLH